MTKTTLVLFWVMWLVDVLITLYGYREFIQGVFGQYATPSRKYISLWMVLFLVAFIVIGGSLYLKNHHQTGMAFALVSVPLVLTTPYVLWMALIALIGKNARWN